MKKEMFVYDWCMPIIIEIANKMSELCAYERDAFVIKSFNSGMTFKEIGKHLNLTDVRVRQIYQRGIRLCLRYINEYQYISKNNLVSQIDTLNSKIKMLECQIAKEKNGKIENNFDVSLRRLCDFDLSVRALNCLKSAEIEYVWQLTELSIKDLLRFRNFGKKSIMEIKELLGLLGLSLKKVEVE